MIKNYFFAGIAALGLTVSSTNINAQMVSDFESLTLAPESVWNGSDLSGVNNTTKFITNTNSGDASFVNVWDTTWGAPGYWSTGFAQSTYTDSVTSGAANIFSAKATSGNGASLTYLVSQNNSQINLQNSAEDTIVTSIYITNGTYSYNSMRDGDSFAKKFGGATGNDADWFMVTIKGITGSGTITTDSVNFYLADFRFTDNTQDYIVKTWEMVDLTSLGNIKALTFALSSSDNGAFGMNTPAFLCVDDLKSTGSSLVDFEDLGFTTADSVFNGSDMSGTPNDLTYEKYFADGDASFFNEWSTAYGGLWSRGFAYSNITDTLTSGFASLYSARAGMGARNSDNYVISQNNTSIKLTGTAANNKVKGMFVTNGTFAANSMRDGDNFAKKFGGTSGDDQDWFLLTIRGYNNGVMSTDTVDFYLADYRFSDNTQDYIVTNWQYVDLTALGNVDSVTFELRSSDAGAFGINTPAFFAMDNFNGTALSTRDLVAQIDFSIYPNPAVDVLNISTDNGNVETVQILDLSGRLVKSIQNLNGNQTIDISDLNTGVYFVQVSVNGTVETKRLVVQ